MKFLYAGAVGAAMVMGGYFAFAAEEPVCAGEIWVVRTSRIIEGGSVAGFTDAVQAQMAWYRANGVTDNEIAIGPAFDDAPGRTAIPLDDMIVTIHMNSPAAGTDALPYGDEGWNAFVERFRANSEIVEEKRFCKTGL